MTSDLPTHDLQTDGRYFEDFVLNEIIHHATPRTVSDGDAALYQSLYGGRHALHSSAVMAQNMGLPDRPLDDWLVFHIVFGKTVSDISRHALANLGYADGRFLKPVFAGDTLSARSTIIGLRENKSGETGLVMVESEGRNQHDEAVLRYQRWVMVKKRDTKTPTSSAASPPVWPTPPEHVAPENLPPPTADFSDFDFIASGSAKRFDDFQIGDSVHHGDGTTLEEAEHMMATRLYQNTAAVHFDALLQADSRFGKRLIYGGHIISHARAMSFNGLQNAMTVLALNGGTHAAPAFAGDTIYAFSEIIDKAILPGRDDVGALRVMHYVAKGAPMRDCRARQADGTLAREIILQLDVWLAIGR